MTAGYFTDVAGKWNFTSGFGLDKCSQNLRFAGIVVVFLSPRSARRIVVFEGVETYARRSLLILFFINFVFMLFSNKTHPI